MKKRLFMFVTPDGVTYSSPGEIYPDVENLQVLGFGEGHNEEEAFEDFIKNNKWVLETKFKEVICIEVKSRLYQSKRFYLDKEHKSPIQHRLPTNHRKPQNKISSLLDS